METPIQPPHIVTVQEQANGLTCCFHIEMNSEGNSCYIYHGVTGTCKASCEHDEKVMAGMGVCQGDLCCYKLPCEFIRI